MLLAALTATQLIQYAVIALAALALIYILFKIGKGLLRVILAVIVNSVLGFMAILLLDYIFGLGIPFTLPIVIATALFGLPAVGTFVILKLLGVALLA